MIRSMQVINTAAAITDQWAMIIYQIEDNNNLCVEAASRTHFGLCSVINLDVKSQAFIDELTTLPSRGNQGSAKLP